MTRGDPSLKAGDLFQNQFEIRGLLGSGGHAFVYRALDQIMGREVALKLIEIPLTSASDRRRRARLEAQVLSKLDHPNIVRVFGAGATDDGWIYLVMEVLEGRSLREAVEQYRKLRLGEALLIGARIADGVHAAHQVGTVHRDLKPENVFLESDNKVRIIDFGVAKFEAPEAQTTQRDLIQGTLYYMSPEHLQGFGVTARSDVFALGVTLYELLAGIRPALVGLQEVNPNAVIYQQIYRMPPALHELRPDIPEFVGKTIQRMLAKNPVDRMQGMAEVASILRAHLARWRAEVGPVVSKICDLSRPFASEGLDAGERAAHTTAKEAHLAIAVTRPLESPAVVQAAALPTSDPADATMRLATDNDPPSPTSPGYATRFSPASSPAWWSVASAAERRPVRRVVGRGITFGAAIGVALGLTALSLRQHAKHADAGHRDAAAALNSNVTSDPAANSPRETAPVAANFIPRAAPDLDAASPTLATADALPQTSASSTSRAPARDDQARLPSSGLDEPRSARTRTAPRSRPSAPTKPVPQFGPEDIR